MILVHSLNPRRNQWKVSLFFKTSHSQVYSLMLKCAVTRQSGDKVSLSPSQGDSDSLMQKWTLTRQQPDSQKDPNSHMQDKVQLSMFSTNNR